MDLSQLKQIKKEKKLTLKDIATLSGLPKRTVEDIFSGTTKNPRIDTITAIEKALGLDKKITIKDEIKLESLEIFPIPLIGEVVAGKPIESEENLEGYVYVNYKPANEYFALRVFGDSMINAGIKEKTILICHKQTYADNGDIVVALLNGEQTVKYYKEDADGNKFLIPANNNYLPIPITEKDDILILGKVKEARNSF